MIHEATAILGSSNIITGDKLLRYQQNLTGLIREVIAVFRPQTTEQVIKLVELANRRKISVYPISKGKNWGMGSQLPVQDNCAIIDLSQLNQIRRVDEHFGTATIEPGVTQKQLSDHLHSISAPFFVDVTGSGADTSIIGNALERGVAYNSERVSQIINFEILTGKGEIIKTGFNCSENSLVNDLYRHGIGPAIDGLFFQSNFGIVLSATISLMPVPEYQVSFSLSLNSDDQLPLAINIFSDLLKNKIIDCVPHIFDRNRFCSLAAPSLYLKLKENKQDISPDQSEKILAKMIRGQWFIGGTIMGDKKIVKSRIAVMKNSLKSLGRLRIMPFGGRNGIISVLKFLGMRYPVALIEAMSPLMGLNKGIPTDATIKSIYWPSGEEKSNLENIYPDDSLAGLKIVAVVCPMVGFEVSRLLGILKKIEKKYPFYISTSLNGISFRYLEIVISIHFSRSDASEIQKANESVRDMVGKLIKDGFYPIRSGIETMDMIIQRESYFWKIAKDLKSIFDPNLIISPGRYNLL